MSTILIGGGTGFVGGHLSRRLRSLGHEVRHLSRSARPNAEFPTFQWDIQAKTIDDAAFQEVDYIINLAGAGIADSRWTEKRKQLIINSRTESTHLLASTISRLGIRPKQYLSASAIGYYGDRGEEVLTEVSAPGTGFLSESCRLWEESTKAIEDLGVPVFINRTGIVLHPTEGALQKMLIPLNFWVSTYFGNGQQFYSWVHIDDLVATYVYAIQQNLTGIYNCVAPSPIRNKSFAAALGPALGKGALVLPAPVFALKIALGEMSHTILDSARCSSQKMENAGFNFQHPELSGALRHLLS